MFSVVLSTMCLRGRRCSLQQPMTAIEDEDEFEDDWTITIAERKRFFESEEEKIWSSSTRCPLLPIVLLKKKNWSDSWLD